jgi:hypothetical protein
MPRSNLNMIGMYFVFARLGRVAGDWSTGRLDGQTGGERGIRTPDRGVSPYNGLANRRLQPLGHLSVRTRRDAKSLYQLIYVASLQTALRVFLLG